MQKEEVIEKIRKLLALSQSPNEHEAAFAAAKAKELMDRYEIEHFDFRDTKNTNNFNTISILKKTRHEEFVTSLFLNISRCYDCFPYYNKTYEPYRGRSVLFTSFTVLGYKKDVEIIQYVFSYLLDAIEKLFQKELVLMKKEDPHWDRKDSFELRRSFCLGAIHRIIQMVQEERKSFLLQNAKCFDLVVLKADAIKEYIDDNLKMKKGPAKMWSGIVSSFYNNGYAKAAGIQMRKAIGR